MIWERKATPAGKADRPRQQKASAYSAKSTIKFNRAIFYVNIQLALRRRYICKINWIISKEIV
ncbi:MAG: hypothetical protein ACE3JN_07690 [Ectobacillus sp.]